MEDIEDSPSNKRRETRRESSVESPSKRRKVRFSSTPQRGPQRKLLDDFPDVSSICSSHNESPPQRKSSTDESLERLSILEDESLANEEVFIDYDGFFSGMGRIKFTGRIEKLFKPLRDDSLYRNIFNNPKNSEDIAVEVIEQYEDNPTEAVLKLFELLIDLSGYQKVNIRPLCDISEENWHKKVFEFLESAECDAEVYVTKEYLFGAQKTKQTGILRMAVFNFIQKLIFLAETKRIFYDKFFAEHFLGVLKSMSKRELCNIRHTASVFGAKILSTLCTIKWNKLDDSSHSDNKYVEELILQFYLKIFVKNCIEINSDKHHFILEDLIREVRIWINIFPKLFISDFDCIHMIVKLVQHSSKNVRIEALKLCQKLVETTDFYNYFSEKARSSFLSSIEERLFLDVNEDVTVLAAGTLSLFIQNKFGTVSEETITNILRFVTLPHPHHKTNKPCGNCWFAFLINSGYSTKHIILEVIKLCRERQVRIPSIVESLLDEFPFLTNWTIIVELLQCQDIEIERKIILSKISYETIHQVLLGRPSTIMTIHKKGFIVDDSAHVEIACNFLPLTKYFLIKYRNVPNILIPLVKIVMLLNVEILPINFAEQFIDIFNAARIVFMGTDNTELQEVLGDFFLCLNEKYHEFLPNTQGFVEKILASHSQKFQKSVLELDEVSIDLLNRLGVLYSKFDMTLLLPWEQMQLDVELTHSNYKVIENLLTCCYWCLIWQLTNLAKKYSSPDTTDELQPLIHKLQKHCGAFLERCLNLMTNLRGEDFHFKVFDLLSKLHIKFANNLKDMCNYYKGFEVLILSLEDNIELNSLLTNFVVKYVIINKNNLSLEERRRYLQHIIDISFLGCMPVGNLGFIFKYYASHEMEFGAQIERAISELQAGSISTTIPLVMVHTLRLVYVDLLQKQKQIDIHSIEAKEFLGLVNRFVSFKMKLENFLLFVINYASQSPLFYPFLYFARPFVDLASSLDKAQALALIEVKLNNVKDVCVVYFINALNKMTLDSIEPRKEAKNKIPKTGDRVMPPPLPILITPQQKHQKSKKTQSKDKRDK